MQLVNLLIYFILLVAKPIDLLAKYISTEDEELGVEMHEPYTYLNVSYHLKHINGFSSKHHNSILLNARERQAPI